MAVALEVCVDTIDGVAAAQAGGAARVELCAALSEGGLTPSMGLMAEAAKFDVPCYAMIRPRAGLFAFSDAEVAVMLADARAAKAAGLAGLAIGVQDGAGGLDLAGLRALVAVGLPCTLHRVIDVVPDWRAAIDIAVEVGIERVLTSGGAARAMDGAGQLREMVDYAAGRISVMAGSGVTAGNVAELVRLTGVGEVHASCAVVAQGDAAFSNFDPVGGRKVTDASRVQRIVEALR